MYYHRKHGSTSLFFYSDYDITAADIIDVVCKCADTVYYWSRVPVRFEFHTVGFNYAAVYQVVYFNWYCHIIALVNSIVPYRQGYVERFDETCRGTR